MIDLLNLSYPESLKKIHQNPCVVCSYEETSTLTSDHDCAPVFLTWWPDCKAYGLTIMFLCLFRVAYILWWICHYVLYKMVLSPCLSDVQKCRYDLASPATFDTRIFLLQRIAISVSYFFFCCCLPLVIRSSGKDVQSKSSAHIMRFPFDLIIFRLQNT